MSWAGLAGRRPLLSHPALVDAIVAETRRPSEPGERHLIGGLGRVVDAPLSGFLTPNFHPYTESEPASVAPMVVGLTMVAGAGDPMSVSSREGLKRPAPPTANRPRPSRCSQGSPSPMMPDPKTTLNIATKQAWTLLDEFKAFAF